jgi:hypothetical protein
MTNVVVFENGVKVVRPAMPDELEFILPTSAQIAALRKAAYQNEADPLYFKAQREEATMDEWLAKIAEIKARYPEPDA